MGVGGGQVQFVEDRSTRTRQGPTHVRIGQHVEIEPARTGQGKRMGDPLAGHRDGAKNVGPKPNGVRQVIYRVEIEGVRAVGRRVIDPALQRQNIGAGLDHGERVGVPGAIHVHDHRVARRKKPGPRSIGETGAGKTIVKKALSRHGIELIQRRHPRRRHRVRDARAGRINLGQGGVENPKHEVTSRFVRQLEGQLIGAGGQAVEWRTVLGVKIVRARVAENRSSRPHQRGRDAHIGDHVKIKASGLGEREGIRDALPRCGDGPGDVRAQSHCVRQVTHGRQVERVGSSGGCVGRGPFHGQDIGTGLGGGKCIEVAIDTDIKNNRAIRSKQSGLRLINKAG